MRKRTRPDPYAQQAPRSKGFACPICMPRIWINQPHTCTCVKFFLQRAVAHAHACACDASGKSDWKKNSCYERSVACHNHKLRNSGVTLPLPGHRLLAGPLPPKKTASNNPMNPPREVGPRVAGEGLTTLPDANQPQLVEPDALRQARHQGYDPRCRLFGRPGRPKPARDPGVWSLRRKVS